VTNFHEGDGAEFRCLGYVKKLHLFLSMTWLLWGIAVS
jgi:hypothetical protein